MNDALVVLAVLGKWVSLTLSMAWGLPVLARTWKGDKVDGRKVMAAAAATAMFLLLEGWL